MKKILLFLVFGFVFFLLPAQSNEKSLVLKYVVTAPDGSVAMTVIDDTRSETVTLESAIDFYKYQLLDTHTSNSLLSKTNRGRSCTIDKSMIGAGTYNLRLFTKNFIITSEITITEPPTLLAQTYVVAANE